jgi:hypothetical protein
MWETVGWLAQAGLPWLPGGLWCAWFLWGVNWKHAWGVLASGGWVGVVLLTFLGALAWSAVFPRPTLNFWWHLGACSALAVAALFCGWLQGRLGWAPAEVSFDPPADHGHGHHHH